MEDTMQLANSPVMWAFAAIMVGMVVLQSVLLYRHAKKYINTTQLLSQQERKACFKSAAVVTVGPAVSVFIVALSMISMLGAPITMMRIGIIGSAPTEMMAAGVGASAAGVNLGVDALTGTALTAAVWTMAFMSCGYLIFVPLVTRGLGRTVEKITQPKADGKRSIWAILLGVVLPLGLFGALAYGQVSQSWGHVAALVMSAILMVVLNLLARKLEKKWIREWAMGFAVVGGIIAGAVVGSFL